MTLTVTVDGTAILDAIPPASVESQQSADMGQASFGGFDIDDPDATITTVGHNMVTVEESACSQPRLFTGYLTERDLSRSVERGMIAGEDARAHFATMVDLNAVFAFRTIAGPYAKRPAETMSARLTWLLAHWSLAGFIEDTGFITTYDRPMDEADYTGATPAAVLADLAGRLPNLSYFAFWDVTAAAPGLYFGPEYVGISESALYISNDMAEVDGSTTFYPDAEAKLARTPEEVYSECLVEYSRGTKRLFRTRPATAAAFVPRGTTIQRPYTGSKATAEAQGDAWLAKHSVETDTISVVILVPPESAGLALAGQSINVRFTHLPGYEDWTSMFIKTSTVTPVDDMVMQYRVALELVAPAVGIPPEPEPLGFHQLILCNAEFGDDVDTNLVAHAGHWDEVSTHTTLWSGSLTRAGITMQLPAVVQDTDGYTGTPGDMQDITVSEWTIPEGLGGVYEVGWEQISINIPGDSWYLPVPPEGSPNPQPVPYTYSNEPSGNGATLVAPTFTSELLWSLVGTDVSASVAQTGGWWRAEGRVGPVRTYIEEGTTLRLDTSFVVHYRTIVPPSGVFPMHAWFGGYGLAEQSGIFTMRLVEPAEAPEYEGEDLGPVPQATTLHETDPGPDDDADAGYTPGSIWVNTASGRAFILADSTADAAVWQIITTPDPISVEDDADPTVDDDAEDGYTPGSIWVNTDSGEAFVAVDVSPGAAIWESLTAVDPHALDDLTDVDTTGAAEGDVLTFDDGTSTWLATALPAPSATGIVFHVVAVFDAGTETITGNPEVEVVIPADGTLTSWTLLADGAGSAVIDIYSDVYGNYPPTAVDSITAAAPPTLTSEAKATDSTLTGWDKTLTAGDILRFHLDSATSVKRLVLTLTYTRS